jgi:hypothetical protein
MFACLATLLVIPALSAQTSSGKGTVVAPHTPMHVPIIGFNSELLARVKSAPFSLRASTEREVILADGTCRKGRNEVAVYRDSAGRVRIEQPQTLPVDRRPMLFTVTIADPVAGYKYRFDAMQEAEGGKLISDTSTPVVIRTAWAAPTPEPRVPSRVTCDQANLRPTDPDVTVSMECLGREMMEGVSADGRRVKHVYAGDGHSVTQVAEIWFSPELGIDMLRKDDDPRKGAYTTRVESLNRSEPDAALFVPPPGYEIVDAHEQKAR